LCKGFVNGGFAATLAQTARHALWQVPPVARSPATCSAPRGHCAPQAALVPQAFGPWGDKGKGT